MRAFRSASGLAKTVLAGIPAAIVLLLLAVAPTGQAATEYVPWMEQGGSTLRTGANPNGEAGDLSLLASIDVGVYGSGSSPLAVDLNGDGDLEILWASDFQDDWGFNTVHAFDFDGTNLVRLWETDTTVSLSATDTHLRLAANDFDGDGSPEIVVWSAQFNSGGAVNTNAFMALDVLDAQGNLLAMDDTICCWPSQKGLPHPSVADVTGNGDQEIIVAGQDLMAAFSFDGSNLNLLWEETIANGVQFEFAVGDADPTRMGNEIVISQDVANDRGAVYTCRPTASTANCTAGNDPGFGVIGMALHDVTGDGYLDAVTGGRVDSRPGMAVFENDGTGTFTFLTGRTIGFAWNTPVVADMNLDGDQEIIQGFNQAFIDVTEANGDIYTSTFDGANFVNKATIAKAGMLPNDDNRFLYMGAAGNLIDDDKLEFVSLDSGGELNILSYDASADPSVGMTFTGSATRAPPIVADINGDCALDVIAGFQNGNLWLLGDDTPRTVPSAPQNLAGTESGTSATLTWEAPATDGGRPVTEYIVLRGLRDGALAPIATVGGNTFTFTDSTGPPFAAEVDYQVQAINCMGNSTDSNKIGLDVHQAPVESTNTGLDLPPYADETVTASNLTFTDDLSDAAGITFTVTDVPSDGSLKLGGTTLAVDGTFTMADISSGLLHYEQLVCPPLADSFSFNVSDHHGKWTLGSFQFRAPSPEPLRIVNATSASVMEGSVVMLNDAHLLATDPCVPDDDLVYTIDELPGNGTTMFAGSHLANGDTLTQAEWLAGVRFASTGGAGTEILRVTISNGLGLQLLASVDIVIGPASPPDASMASPAAPHYGGLEVRFIDQSTAGTYPITSRVWEVLDASGNVVYTTGEGTLMYTPALGEYTVTLTVGDGFLFTDQASYKLIVDQSFEPAIPEFLMSDATPEAGDPVTFWDTSKKGTFAIESREWNFQDPHPPTEDASVLHIFDKPGTYLVSLKIQDAKGFEYFATHELIVSEPTEEKPYKSFLDELANLPKGMALADAGPDQVVLAGTIVELDGRASRPGPGANNLTYQWSHVGGMQVPIHGADTMTPRVSLPFITLDEGEVLLQLVVTDEKGQQSAPDVVRLLVRKEGVPSLKPVPEPTGQFDIDATETGNVTFVANDRAGTGVAYVWDFGDGTIVNTTSDTVIHRYEQAGVYQVRLRVEDSFGRVAEYQRAVQLDDPAQSEEDVEPQAAPRPQSTSDGNGGYLLLLLLAIAVSLGSIGFVAYAVLRSRKQKA